MGLKCLFTGHKWKYFSHFNYRDSSYCEADQAAPSNTVTKECEYCGKMKVFTNYCGGHYQKEGE